MADKTLGMLVPATDIFPTDLFLVEQSGVAKNVPGQVMINFLTRVADGHGGVTDFKQLSISGREKTYQFTMADQTTYSFTVTDGNDIADFQHSVSGLVHTCKFIMDDGTEYSFSVSDGAKGDKGDNAYVHIRFASEKPTSSSSSMGTEPDDWIGFYSGNKSVAPTDPLEYTWAPFKGEQGNVGSPATLATAKVEYQVGTSGTVTPSGEWSASVPATGQGKYLWTRITIQFNTGKAIQFFSVGYFGINGTGAVASINGVTPDPEGNVALTADDVGALPITGGTMQGTINMNGQSLGGLNDPTEPDQAARKSYVDAKYVYATLTASGWSASAPYTQTVTVAGVTAKKPPHITPVYPGTEAEDKALKEATGAVSYAKPGAGTVTFTCLNEKPAIDIEIQCEVRN